MNPKNSPNQYLTASTPDGMLIIHGSPVTLTWIPRDVVSGAYNVGGIVSAGTFDTIGAAKNVGREQYSVSFEDWHSVDELPFDSGAGTQTELHTPEIDGHKIVRHGIHWK